VPPVLLLTLRFHEGRYHGAGDWPPSPARLFQALLAGAVRCGALPADDAAALRRMEAWPPPVIATPPVRHGQKLRLYVPNNDLDAVGGDFARIEEIRTPKLIRPCLFDPEIPLLYAWPPPYRDPDPARFCAIAARLYQLGRGIDMAFATAEWLDAETTEARLAAHPGPVHRPSSYGRGGSLFACPEHGSLDSLLRRHEAQGQRFQCRDTKTLFVQPPKPRFRRVAYDCPPTRLLFALRDETGFRPWPLAKVVALVEAARDAATARLIEARHPEPATIERILIGRGAAPADIRLRPRLIPLPSIGATHSDHAIRRLLVEIPPDCPIRADDLDWAFSGLPVGSARLVRAEAADRMLGHYRPEAGARLWCSVTPVALPPVRAARRSGGERPMRGVSMAAALSQALRHAGIRAQPIAIRLQREPFSARGARAEAFARPPRFPTARLTHAEIRFAEPLDGPLVLGDGRWLGLGLFRPIREEPGILAFAVLSGLAADAGPEELARALRRATMARVQDRLGDQPLPPFFSGHGANGAPLRNGTHCHLAFAVDLASARLLVIAPHRLEGRPPSREERQQLALLDEAMTDFTGLRAGKGGLLRLAPTQIDEGDPLLGPARAWVSLTQYSPTRHAKRLSPAEALAADCRRECRRRGWPEPEVQVLDAMEGPRGGVRGTLRLTFPAAQTGPILLGRFAHLGGGLFAAAP